MAASGFWQVRCWVYGKSYRRSSRIGSPGDWWDVRMPVDLSWAIRLLVNGFMRPSDLKYLRLTLPETKGHGTPIVTMPAAVHVYRQILRERANCCAPSDYFTSSHHRP